MGKLLITSYGAPRRNPFVGFPHGPGKRRGMGDDTVFSNPFAPDTGSVVTPLDQITPPTGVSYGMVVPSTPVPPLMPTPIRVTSYGYNPAASSALPLSWMDQQMINGVPNKYLLYGGLALVLASTLAGSKRRR